MTPKNLYNQNSIGSNRITIKILLFLILISFSGSCQERLEIRPDPIDNPVDTVPTYKLPNIDLSHWKVTLPIGNPLEIAPPEILDYATTDILKQYMYNDSVNGGLVFYTFPNSSTANSSYSRTELREQMVAGSNSTNWTFAQGGYMKGTLSVPLMSKDASGNYYRSIIMQIHGRLTNEQRDLIGAKDNNAPPVLKIYWTNGYVRVKTKELKDLNASDTEILATDAWTDDDGYTFKEYVGNDKFTLEVKVSEGRLEVVLNNNESKVYDNIHLQKWGIFENYFKAGNYFQTHDKEAYSKVEYYSLEVHH
jgi:hypothetical protein